MNSDMITVGAIRRVGDHLIVQLEKARAANPYEADV